LNDNNGLITAIATVILAVATIFLAIIAHNTDSTYRITARNSLRAYLSLQDFELICRSCDGNSERPDQVVIKAVNNGQTPARYVLGYFGWHPTNDKCGRRSGDFSYVYSETDKFFDLLSTFSKDASDSVRFQIVPAAIHMWKNGGTLCLYGAITYQSIFAANHTTKFCYWQSSGSRKVLCEVQNSQD
jgi:hypothetical protein